MPRPSTLLAVGALVLGLATPATAHAEPSPGEPIALTLPGPTGATQLGTVSLHLIDPAAATPGYRTIRCGN